ncbi:hypothetical protein ACWC9H_27295 [Streptomyces sp. NPDC001251]
MTSKDQTPKPYRISTRFDALGRYRVTVAETVIGYVSRWHREWDTVSSNGDHRVGRPPVGQSGAEFAAQWLYDQYTAGAITAMDPDASTDDARTNGRAPLLDPRMPDTPTNRRRAAEVRDEQERWAWRPVSGYPGSDNHQMVHCLISGTTLPMYWSHLRGRGGRPASAARHIGCLDEATVRRLLPAYTLAKKPSAAEHPAPPALPTGIDTRYSAGHILCEALAAHGHTVGIRHHDGSPYIVVPLPGGPAEVWITPDSSTPTAAVTLDYTPAAHVHWRAAVRPQGADSDAWHPICTPRPPSMAADVKRLLRAIKQRTAQTG